MMRVDFYWSKLGGNQYGYLDWGVIWSATNINVVWKLFLGSQDSVSTVGTGIFRRCYLKVSRCYTTLTLNYLVI